MNIFLKTALLFTSYLLLTVPTLLSADIIPAPLGSGSPNLFVLGGPNLPNPMASLSYDITQSGNIYTYTYNLSTNGPGSTSNSLVIELNPIITSSNVSTYILSGITGGFEITTFSPNTYGIGFSSPATNGASQIVLTSTLAPMWGRLNFSSFNDPNQIVQAEVAGDANPPSSSDSLAFLEANYVPVIGVPIATPEPSTFLLLGTGLIAASAFGIRKKSQRFI